MDDCPYYRLAEPCTAGPRGHAGPHTFPPGQCDYYLHTLGVSPIRCSLAEGHSDPHDYPRKVTVAA